MWFVHSEDAPKDGSGWLSGATGQPLSSCAYRVDLHAACDQFALAVDFVASVELIDERI